jgi:hypothetical protein
MRAATLGWALVLGWMLVYHRPGSDSRPVDRNLDSSSTCEQLRAARIAEETNKEIGSALASQPADNPMRVEAWRRAEPRVRERWRCEPEG